MSNNQTRYFGMDPTLILATILVLILLGVVILCARIFPNDGQTFQVVASILSGVGTVLVQKLRHPNGELQPGENEPTIQIPGTPTDPPK